MIKPRFVAKIGKGALVFNNPDAVSAYLRGFKVGQEIDVIISKRSKPRTTQQNAYLWAVVYPITAKETGHTCLELHEAMKAMFLPPTFVELNGKRVRIPSSTKLLSVAEESEFLERVIAEFSSMGIIIPPAESITL
ncbi:MAG: hypothetical protein WC764_04270 [Candidatus Paceibacterota bacterium]|jgi:hypothetical protein